MAIKKTLCFTLVVLALTCPDEISGGIYQCSLNDISLHEN